MDQHAYIARMEAAVQNSLKALSELKRQNALLLEENESLKEKLREYSEGTVRAATEAMDVNSQQVVDEASESRLELNGSCSSNRIDNVRVESSASSVPSNIPANVDNANSSIVPSSRRVSAAYSSNIAAHWTGTGVQLKVSTPAVPNASEDYASAVQKAKGGSEKSISSQTRVSTAREFKGNETEPSNTTKKLPATPASTVQLGEPKISQQFELGFSRVHGNFADLRLNQSTVLSLLQKMRVENVHKCAEMCCKSNALVLSKAIFQYLTVNEDTLKETIEIMQSKVNRKSCLSKALNNQISLVVLLLVSLYTTQVGCDKLVSSVLKNLRSLCLGSAKKKSPVKLFHYLHGMDSSLQDSFKDTSHAYTYSSSGVAAASSSSGNTETIPISNDARKNVLQSLLQFDTDSDDNSDSDIVSETKGKCEDFGCRDDNSQSSSSSNKLETSGFDVAASHFTDSCEPHLNKVVTERLVDPSIQSSSAGDYENERIPESEINSDLLIEDGGYSIKVNRAGDLRLECKVAAVSLMILCTTTHLGLESFLHETLKDSVLEFSSYDTCIGRMICLSQYCLLLSVRKVKTVDAYLKIIYAAVKTILSGSTFLDFSIHDQNIPDENDLHPRCKSISVAQLSKNACSMFVEVYESRFHSEDIAVNVGGSILETFHSMQSEGNFDIYHTPSVGDKVLAMYRNKYNGIFTLHNTAMTKVMEALGIDCIAKHYETINGAIMFFNTKVEVSRNDGQEITNRFMSINCSTEQYNFANILSDDSFALIELTPSEVKCLSPVDHKATVEAWSQTAVIQDILIPHFRQHWRTKLYPGHNRGDESVEINTSREIFEKVSLLWNFLSSLLHSEYDGDSWRSGLTGSGIALEDQCKIRISAINNISKTLPGFDWFVAPENIFGTDSVCARSTLKKCLQQLCSCSYDEFFNLLALLDHIVKQFSTVSAVASDNAVMADDFCKSHSKAKLSLISQAKELISIASLCCMERIITTIFFSLRGLLWALQLKKNNDPDRDSEELMALVISVLESLPAPWDCSSNFDVHVEIFNALHSDHFHSLVSRNSTLSNFDSAEPISDSMPAVMVGKSIARIRNAIPVFVINLDRRPDRWRRILGMCSAAKLVPIRVPALDGNRLYEPPGEIQTSLLLNSTKFCCDSDSFVQSIDDTLAVCIGCSVEYHFISDSSVTRSWDSTLNATFDSSCLPNTATPLTNGERACAASHLKIWNLIRVIASTDKDQAISEKLDQCSILIDHQNRRQCLGHSVCGSSYFNWLKLFFRLKSFGSVNNSDNKYFLIFEDDAQINSLEIVQFKETVVALMAELPEEADILYLGHSTPSTAKKAIFRGGKYVKVNYLWQLHAYAIRYKAIEKLLKHLPIDQPVDNFIAKLAHEEKLNVYTVGRRTLVSQHGGSLSSRRDSSDIRHSGRVAFAREKRNYSSFSSENSKNARGKKKRRQ